MSFKIFGELVEPEAPAPKLKREPMHYSRMGYQRPEKTDFKEFGEVVEQPMSKVKSVTNAALEGVLEGSHQFNPLQPPNSPLSWEGKKKLIKQFLPHQEGTAEDVAKFGGSLAPSLIGGEGNVAAQQLKKTPQIVKGTVEAVKKVKPKEIVKLPSGLSKPRAVDSKLAKYASIGKETRAQAVKRIETEASQLTEQSLKRNVPLIEEAQMGFDREKMTKGFAHLDQSIKKKKDFLNLEPIEKHFDELLDKYRGVPNPHTDVKKIQTEIKAFRKKPPKNGDQLLKTYRSNNKKLGEIREKALVEGKQAEYAQFLREQNKAIAQSFRDTYGKDSAWVRQFDELNSLNTKMHTADDTLAALDHILRGKTSPHTLEKLAHDPKAQKQLAVTMRDPKAAQEIIQISKDLQAATDSIKKISRTQLNVYDAVLPTTYLVPLLGPVIGGGTSIHSGYKLGKNLLGYWLSRPQTRRAYGDAVKALKAQDIEGYKRAAAILLQSRASGAPSDED